MMKLFGIGRYGRAAAWPVVIVAIAGALLCTLFAATHFSVSTDVRELFPQKVPWTERQTKFSAEFPEYDMVVIVDAPTEEYVEAASAALTAALKRQPDRFRAADDLQESQFFRRNGLLFLPVNRLAAAQAGFAREAPLIAALNSDPSLRGILRVFSASLYGVTRHQYSLDALSRPMDDATRVIDNELGGEPASFSWTALQSGQEPGEQHRFIQVAPILDFKSLEPGRAANEAINQLANDLGLAQKYQAHVRVTGLVPMNDAQFSTLKDNALLNAIVSIGAVLLILWLALRSWRLIFAAAVSVACGLAYTAALGIFIVGSLNLISVAFFVLFVGLAVDFALQFSVRYRAERHELGDDLESSLGSAFVKARQPLALAGAATALGFCAFLPTNYRGLSELGMIAGPGMLIAFVTSVTLLPALLVLLRPPNEPAPMTFSSLAAVDHFLQRRRLTVLVVTLGTVLLASPLLFFLKFDFNTLHLQNPKAPAVAAFLSLRKDPMLGANAVEISADKPAAAEQEAAQIQKLPEVAATRTLASFIPEEQTEKLSIINRIRQELGPAFASRRTRPAPGDRELQFELRETASELSRFARMKSAGGDSAWRLARALRRLAGAEPQDRAQVSAAMVVPLKIALSDLRESLDASPVTSADLPEMLKRQWLAPDGHARIEVLPKGDPDDTAAMRDFVGAVLAKFLDATGPAVTLYMAGNTVVRSFLEAGLFSLVAIALLLFLALRRVPDVLMTLVPLLLAALATLELCVVLGIRLNFTNIIAFPLLLGVGVAFKIYYIMAWRRGRTALVQSTLTRAVMFSAATTATAFGSLWLSRHPGTSSMGELMMLSLVCTMMAAVFFQPALMGPPRQKSDEREMRKDRRKREAVMASHAAKTAFGNAP